MALRLALLAAGLAFGVYSLVTARNGPAFSFAGDDLVGAIALLSAGWALLVVGFWHGSRRPESAVGPLLMGAGCTWFVSEWDNPAVGSSLAFTIGLVLYATCPPLVAWAALAYPGGRLGSSFETTAAAAALVGASVLLGLLPALFLDPTAEGCTECPANLLLIDGSADRASTLYRVGAHAALAWCVALIAVGARRFATSSPARRSVVEPILLTTAACLASTAMSFALSLDTGFVGSGLAEQRLWFTQAVTLVAVSAAIAWTWIRARRTRATLARLVVELGETPPVGGLRAALARMLDDPDLEIGYPVADGRIAAADGGTIELVLADGRAATPVVREARTVALLLHREDLTDNQELLDDVASAARLALENERLQAEVRTQLDDLRASRSRIVEAADAERRRLERDLHDGAQQRLVSLAFMMRLLRSRVDSYDASEAPYSKLLGETDAEIHRALDDLRRLAHGIYPAILGDAGLAVAVEALADEARAPLSVGAMTTHRFPPAVEAAAYLVIAEASRTGTTTVCASRTQNTVVVDVETTAEPDDRVGLEDRVGALGGTLTVTSTLAGRVRIIAEIPCE